LSLLSEGVARRSRHVRAALVCGPAAWGEMSVDSEVHLAVLSAPERDLEVEVAMWDLAERFRRIFGNRLVPLVETRRQAIALARKGQQPWSRIATEGIPVFGRFPR
jgi:hypothetical protein